MIASSPIIPQILFIPLSPPNFSLRQDNAMDRMDSICVAFP